MKLAVTLLVLGLFLTCAGLFGIAEYLITLPGYEAARKDLKGNQGDGRNFVDPRIQGDLQDFSNRLDRARSIGLGVAIVFAFAGIGFSGLAVRRFVTTRGMVKQGKPCATCGRVLHGWELSRGTCDSCSIRNESA